MIEDNKQTYDFICFTDLAYEFDFSDKKEAERKIKKRLKYYNLAEYNQDRIEYIRQLKNELYLEISKTTKSKYFHKTKSNYAELEDFNFNLMTMDFNTKYPTIEKNDLMGMINYAIYLYHLR